MIKRAAPSIEDIRARDEQIGAFAYLDENAAPMGEGVLADMPFAVKDLIDVEGWGITRGSRYYHEIASADAGIIAKLKRAGAQPIGLVKTYELATVGPDPTSLYAQPRNPWNLAHITGGSSSGSAAAVAAGMVRFALGTDTGGSVRSPAAYCGVAGFKPTKGLLNMNGVAPLSPSLDHLGFLAKSVLDIESVMRALIPDFGENDAPVKKIGYARNWADDPEAHPELMPILDEAASQLSLLGLQIDQIEFPNYAPLEEAAGDIIFAEGYEIYGEVVEAHPDDFGAMARESILRGKDIKAEKLKHAREALDAFAKFSERIFEDVDAIILPTVLSPAPSFADIAKGGKPWTAMRTIPFNWTGQPAISVPMGFIDGLPVGLQIIGAKGADAHVLAVAKRYELATDHSVLLP